MAYIELPDVETVDEPIKKQFEKVKAFTGEIGELVRILAIRPDILDMTNQMVKTLLFSQSELDINTKEYIAILVSLENGCTMCVGEHERIAKLLGIPEEHINKIKEGFESADLQETERALLRFCIKTAKESYKVTDEDFDRLRKAGYSDSQLLEAVALVSYFNYINTISNAMGVDK
jgi:uncharacterized peroxidase-related enzyme